MANISSTRTEDLAVPPPRFAPNLDPAVDEALKAFIAKKKESMPDMWH